MSGLLKFITCGSVDDGKSTLIGHILYDSKLLYADQEKALELDSKVGSRGGAIDYSLLLDGLMAEREQGITIDVAYRYFTTEKRSFIVADTPGHEEYTRNMAVGASFADLAVILVDAKQGVLVQTRRHARICALMGIRYFVFAVNKMDLVAKVLSHLIEAGFCRIQFTPDLMPSDVLGTSVFLPSTGKFEFRQGPVFTNILLVDEINRSPAKTQAALFEVMEERQITNDGVEYAMEFPFMVVATQNPVEHEGTYRLPEAQLDRFMFKILVDYPRKEEEIEVLELHDKRSSESWKEQTPVVSVGELSYLREKVHDVHVDGKIKAFIVDIVGTTRDNAWLYLGASPRASIALMNSAKAFAAISGRDFVVPEDVLYLAAPVLRHRVQLSAEKEVEGVVVDQVIQQLIAKVEIPR